MKKKRDWMADLIGMTLESASDLISQHGYVVAPFVEGELVDMSEADSSYEYMVIIYDKAKKVIRLGA